MKKRIVSMMLALLMAFGIFGVFCPYPVSVAAAEATEGTEEGTEDGTGTDDGTGEGETEVEEEPYVAIVDAALTTSYKSAQDKIDSDENMNIVARYGTYELYVNIYTGEVAFRDMTTGQVLLTNPYDVPNYASISTEVRKQLLSQVVVGYTENGVAKTFYSYTEAAARGQIKVKNIKNGIRVEYTLGREDSNYLVPGMITEERMISEIFSQIAPELTDYSRPAIVALDGVLYYDLKQVLANYVLQDPNDKSLPQTAIDEMYEQYPILKTLGKAIYVRSSTTARDLRTLEGIIKTYCPNYTYEELEKDHEETQYVSDELDPPLFKLALEYTLNEEGLSIRLPANGIRFDSSLYTLEYVSPLQYFGAGNVMDDGYVFYPDGSGAIMYYDDLANKMAGTITGKVYGADYAYHEISGKHQESIRMPVFGVVNAKTTVVVDENGDPVTYVNDAGETVEETVTTTTGYLAILEEGDAMANITAAWGGSRHNYASVYTTFYPRPKDSYDLSSSISVGTNSTWTVESSRKYTGSYKLRIVMLSDKTQESALTAAGKNYYEASYVGMARAYSHYLVDIAGVLSPLSAEDVKDGNIPLYIESFGTVPDMQRFFSIPIEVDVPLTTFDDIQTMYKEMSENGITNVNFKLTGFANDGMYSTYPCKLNWMKEVGGSSGFSELLEAAKDAGYGIYPEFDFMYLSNEKIFDGISLRDAGARTIDNRYASKKIYDATYQEVVSFYDICVTPSMIEEYYARFTGSYKGYNPIGISVSTMGSDLNSDFGSHNPTNREDAKKIISEILATVKSDYGSVMTSGGNIYALAYTEHLLEAALDSSRFSSASRSVPFVGMVLHGYVNFAGSAINMAGNVNYQVLKAIENGAGLYFTLSYDNTNLLKEFTDLSKYYSVNYKIWAGTYDDDGNLIEKGELFEIYELVNGAIGDLQTAKIVNHQFLIGERLPSEAEAEADAEALSAALELAREMADSEAKKAQIEEYRQKFENGEISAGEVIDAVASDEEVQAVFDAMNIAPVTTTSDALSGDDYEATKYTMDDGMLVLVTYEGGVSFILNYNVFAAKVVLDGQTYTLDAYGFQRIEK